MINILLNIWRLSYSNSNLIWEFILQSMKKCCLSSMALGLWSVIFTPIKKVIIRTNHGKFMQLNSLQQCRNRTDQWFLEIFEFSIHLSSQDIPVYYAMLSKCHLWNTLNGPCFPNVIYETLLSGHVFRTSFMKHLYRAMLSERHLSIVTTRPFSLPYK